MTRCLSRRGTYGARAGTHAGIAWARALDLSACVLMQCSLQMLHFTGTSDRQPGKGGHSRPKRAMLGQLLLHRRGSVLSGPVYPRGSVVLESLSFAVSRIQAHPFERVSAVEAVERAHSTHRPLLPVKLTILLVADEDDLCRNVHAQRE